MWVRMAAERELPCPEVRPTTEPGGAGHRHEQDDQRPNPRSNDRVDRRSGHARRARSARLGVARRTAAPDLGRGTAPVCRGTGRRVDRGRRPHHGRDLPGPQARHPARTPGMSFLLDTDTCSAHLMRPAGLIHRFVQHSGGLFIPTIVLAELYTWAYHRKNPTPVSQAIETDLLPNVAMLDFDTDCAKEFGRLREQLLQQGISAIRTDLMIAS